ncbi:MAG: CoB--CoM heterodisulfide reductase iron-sulfur subunit A family protein, partial [Syntrophomonadaceae bacterium]|nr:CoB--CoM heterodisulfide reductase iron-sulfur subunit A family protein [Syntrophomonadaceae bacterium]
MSENGHLALIVGGGLAGMEAALKIGQAGYNVALIERQPRLGGVVGQLYSSFPHWNNPQDLLNYKQQQIEKCSNIQVFTNSTVKNATESNGLYMVEIDTPAGSGLQHVKADAVVLATGFDLFDSRVYGEYGYGIYPNVMNSLEFESILKQWGSGQYLQAPPQAVAFFKCVGSRDRSKGLPYCSKICCMYTAKQAGLVKDMFPDSKAYVFYMDYRAAGKDYEEFTRSVIETKHVRYVRGRPSKVLPENGRLVVRAEDTLMGVPIEVEVDLVVLAAAIVPKPETKQLAQMFGAKTDEYGFLESELHNPGKAAAKVF